MNAPTKAVEVTPAVITFMLDGKPVEAFDGESILKAAERSGVITEPGAMALTRMARPAYSKAKVRVRFCIPPLLTE